MFTSSEEESCTLFTEVETETVSLQALEFESLKVKDGGFIVVRIFCDRCYAI